ncbi:DUF2167 domain-containing protein [Ahniella affigens]|nr:DUF2167 domain-containing protein [Ahniella affigens]
MKQLLAAGCALFLAVVGAGNTALADDTEQTAKQFLAALDFKSGDFSLPAANAVIHVNKGFTYLGAKDAQRVLEDLWGNPPDDSVLGMLVPDKDQLLDEHSWAVVLTYSPDGYVSDEDAAKINYSEMLTELQQQTRDGNEWRQEEGYGTIELVGWAEPPKYDIDAKKLHWAKELAFEGADDHTLNYDVRALGRYGYLSMNAVANHADLSQVKERMQDVIAMAEFNQGARYNDYVAGSDKTAEYGLAALVGGAIAAKTGLLGKLFALLLAGKKLLIFVVLGIAAFIKRLFTGRRDDQHPG